MPPSCDPERPENPAVSRQESRTSYENRWCDRWGYFIDIAACEARADRRSSCRRCLRDWRQLSFPFFEKKP